MSVYDYDKQFNVMKRHIAENGEVYLLRGQEFYVVAMVKFNGMGSETHSTRGRLDYISAAEYYDNAVRFVDGIAPLSEPTRKYSCKFNPKKSRSCTDANCPKCLGGAAYREIFGLSCLYRKRPGR